MTPYIARFGGVALALIAIVIGVFIGRVIEAIAVGSVLFTVCAYVGRLLSAPDDGVPGRGERQS